MIGLIVVSILINAAVTLGASADLPLGFTVAMGLCVAISVVGALLIASDRRRPGAMMVMVGCVLFVPIGLIGMFGAKKVFEQLARERFAAESAAG